MPATASEELRVEGSPAFRDAWSQSTPKRAAAECRSGSFSMEGEIGSGGRAARTLLPISMASSSVLGADARHCAVPACTDSK